jgi:PAS domain S-box-containing protein
MNLPSSFKLHVLGLLVVFLLLSVGATWWSAGLTTEKFRRIDHSRQVVTEFKNLLVLLLDSETRVRTYLITGDQLSLEAFQIEATSIGGSMTALRYLTQDDASQSSRLAEMEPLIDRRLALLSEQVRLRQGGEADAAAKVVASGKGKKLVDAIRVLITAGVAEEDALVLQDSAKAQELTTVSFRIVTVSGILTLFVAGAAGLFLQREAQLRSQQESEVSVRSIMDAVPDAVLVTDIEGRVVFLNPSASRLFGYVPEDLLGKPVEALVPKAYRPRHERFRAGYMQDPKVRTMATQMDICGLRADGTEFPITVNLGFSEIRGEKLYIATIHDLTELRQTQRHVDELNALNQELEAFSYAVSHDLRAPLRSIDGFSQILQEEHGAQLNEGGRDCATRIRKAAQRMGMLIDDMLNLSRITRNNLSRSDVNLSALAQELATALQTNTPERETEFAIQPGVTAFCDPGMLRIALDNLLGNSWKFTSTRSPAHIEFGQVKVNGSSAYFVRDDGVGFDMAYAGKLFGAFQRLHEAREYSGTGIGLATVQRIVHKHGGKIWAEAEPGKGATFYFTL